MLLLTIIMGSLTIFTVPTVPPGHPEPDESVYRISDDDTLYGLHLNRETLVGTFAPDNQFTFEKMEFLHLEEGDCRGSPCISPNLCSAPFDHRRGLRRHRRDGPSLH